MESKQIWSVGAFSAGVATALLACGPPVPDASTSNEPVGVSEQGVASRSGACPPPKDRAYDGTVLTTTAAFHQRDGARLHWFRGRYWLLGGCWPTNAPWGEVTTNEVWSSPDGIAWTLELPHDADPKTTGPDARWRRRHTFMSAVHDGYLWVLGSDQFDPQGWLSDVWRSKDGVHWTRVAASSPWTAQVPIVGVYGGAIHVMGGYVDPSQRLSYAVASQQHWATTDGIHWEHLPDMPFARGGVNDAVELCGKLFVIGGSSGTFAS